jgi:hypothetical protein
MNGGKSFATRSPFKPPVSQRSPPEASPPAHSDDAPPLLDTDDAPSPRLLDSDDVRPPPPPLDAGGVSGDDARPPPPLDVGCVSGYDARPPPPLNAGTVSGGVARPPSSSSRTAAIGVAGPVPLQPVDDDDAATAGAAHLA